MAVTPDRWPEGYGRLQLAQVDSTLDEAARQAPHAATPLWVFAQRQTAARGRRGRPWSMPAGNFAATLLMRSEGPPAQAALRSFTMSLALYRSFVEVTGRENDFTLKWPNDVLLKGGKVAGILLESVGAGQQTGCLSIGVGVNLVAAPSPGDVEARALKPVSILRETSVRVSPETFLEVLAGHFAVLEQQFQRYGFDPIRTGWLAQAARLGEVITARTSRDEYTGTFEDVDAEGHLVLRGPRGVMSIAAADVYF
ncbi:biotin--[acetyl-CoA-carboxylase] ligase [Roseobacter denitrificans]|uniref:biotin--[biotin carboxyl-carrier protein] ligase n=1 Tax=Roseobacter denitrificans (strain ATCC 33942 / OCh 114) TaxID=375451 RepID=Q163S5_ROSDO|nr:biotin--[acetyl-CoA-carboxylase] ligase [Roseobacter denitrificans]ABG32768.1 biotin--acetyl-CoA-carboxylase ligase, putative [Roseobacter denitrificans OCh 114]AVL52181.1 biotin--[acetyl-CoA-carboxylase] ligase [Roseobacter denitrificans]SFF94718.1 BirA family transcriptional regulator, biotin operon repressor / biotin-[acetyl-CoA-carboxylase] ligase [Roseobacter denitrificans OCh 114]